MSSHQLCPPRGVKRVGSPCTCVQTIETTVPSALRGGGAEGGAVYGMVIVISWIGGIHRGHIGGLGLTVMVIEVEVWLQLCR
jgi:hypothetical protein